MNATLQQPQSIPVNDHVDEAIAFEVGVLANEFFWHFDQAIFAVSRRECGLALQTLDRLRVKLADVDDSPIAELDSVLDTAEKYLGVVGDEWLHLLAIDLLYRAPVETELESLGEWYFNKLTVGLTGYRTDFVRAINREVLTASRSQLLFRFGEFVDSGRHASDVAKRVCDYKDSDSPERRPEAYLRTFAAGEIPPEPHWEVRVTHLMDQLGVSAQIAIDVSTAEKRCESVQLIPSPGGVNLVGILPRLAT